MNGLVGFACRRLPWPSLLLLMIAWGSAAAATITLGLPSLASEDSDHPANVALGRQLFFDTRLSADGSIACASCHAPERAFADGRSVSLGIGGTAGIRNAPSLLNSAYGNSFFWDGRRQSLVSQVADPFVNGREHGLGSEASLVARVRASPDYKDALVTVGTVDHTELQPTHLYRALAAYLRTLRAGDSAFDRFYYGKESGALDAPAKRGFALFRGRAGCAQCHTIGDESALFTDQGFHSVGIAPAAMSRELAALTTRVVRLSPAELDQARDTEVPMAALGRFLVTKDPRDIGKYKTPSLRNVALTAPYMHDGSVATLHQAVDQEVYYRSTAQRRPLILTPVEREDLVAFLRSLTSACLAQATCSFF